jgi:DNA gyrase inhibitor GyrI
LLSDRKIMALAAPLNLNKFALKEADEKLSKLRDKDVRIVYLPPAAVAASHYIGDEPERHAAMVMDKFVLESGLPAIKPDLRQYGFNHPNPGCIKGKDTHGYEFWVTIPEDMEVPAPLEKKHFPGGLYAAHMIPMGAFEE